MATNYLSAMGSPSLAGSAIRSAANSYQALQSYTPVNTSSTQTTERNTTSNEAYDVELSDKARRMAEAEYQKSKTNDEANFQRNQDRDEENFRQKQVREEAAFRQD